MSAQNHGGPAFPATEQHGLNSGRFGVTVRDYFAAKAMQGLMARVWSDPVTGKAPDNIFEVWSKSAYGLADAMLAERAKVQA